MTADLWDARQLALFGGAVFVGIALLYLLRPRRRQLEVPYGGLWQRVIEKAEARALSSRWRRIWSMLFNCLLAGLMLAALAESSLGLRGCASPPPVQNSHTVLLIDTSASMLSLDGQDTDGSAMGTRLSRLDEALAKARLVVQAALPAERFLVLSADARLRARTGWTDDVDAIHEALGKIQAHEAGFDEEAALQGATDALSGKARGRIIMISDGGAPVAQRRGITAARVEHLQVGPAVAPPSADNESRTRERRLPPSVVNLAVEHVSVRRLPADPGRGVLMARVRNDSARAVRALVTVAASATGQHRADFQTSAALKASKVVTLRPREVATVTFGRIELTASRFAAFIRPAEGTSFRDVALYDDVGFAVLAGKRALHVLLVTAGNNFLEAAIGADDRIAYRLLSPTEYKPDRLAADKGARFDVIVLDQVSLPPPAGVPALILAKHSSAPEKDQMLEAVDLVVRSANHPINNGLTLDDINIDVARALRVGSDEIVLAADRGGSAIMTAGKSGTRRVRLGLDLVDSDIGGRFALPLLIGNVLEWLVADENPLVPPLEVGQVWGIEVPVSDREWTWKAPGKEPVAARVAGKMITCSSVHAGIHVWRSENVELVRSTRLSSSERPGVRTRHKPVWRPPVAAKQRRNQPPERLLWLELLMLALLGLVSEWALYQRRRTV